MIAKIFVSLTPLLTLGLVFSWVYGVNAQQSGAASTPSASETPRSPYTAKFKVTSTKILADGTEVRTESTLVDITDSSGRHLVAYTGNANAPAGQQKTDFQVSDPGTLTMSYWSVPGNGASLVHMPDMGEPESDCAKKVKAITPLHPAGSPEDLPIEDLGNKTILGVEAHGGRVTFSPNTLPVSQLGLPRTRINEVWTAVDPGLNNLMVRLISDGGALGKSDRELISFDRSEPSPKVFEVPYGREIKRREGQAYICSVQPKAPPPSAVPAK